MDVHQLFQEEKPVQLEEGLLEAVIPRLDLITPQEHATHKVYSSINYVLYFPIVHDVSHSSGNIGILVGGSNQGNSSIGQLVLINELVSQAHP
jgi:hypothetical protein